MSPNLAGQFGDTTYTKVFVGGLAWETQRETMRKYFDQFGDILEAVVITDKNTGRSKGYGFVTFSEPEAAMRACVDPSPVIDGRRANCNLASLGVQKSTPTTPQHGGKSFRVMKSVQGGMGGAAGFAATPAAAAALPHYAIQQGIPYNHVYGYPPYSPEYGYPTSYYNVYGGAAAQYPVYTGAAAGGFYPYFQFGQGYGMQYPPQMFQYSAVAASAGLTGFGQHYGSGPMPFAPNAPAQPAVCFAIKQA